MPENKVGPAKLKVHAVNVHDAKGRLVRTHLQKGGKYWGENAQCGVHPEHGISDEQGVIHHEVVD